MDLTERYDVDADTAVSKKKGQEEPARIVLEPPEWTDRVAAGSGAIATLYFAYRLVTKVPGIGMMPYAVALAGVALFLLHIRRDRIEIDNEKLTWYRGGRVRMRTATRNIEEVRAGFFSRRLVCRDGRAIGIHDLYTNADRVGAFFRRRSESRAERERGERWARKHGLLVRSAETGQPLAAPARQPARTRRPDRGSPRA